MDIEVLYWYWMVLGLILIVAEIFIPSFTILWFGIGAMLVGMTMLVVDISFTIQVLLWTLFSICLLYTSPSPRDAYVSRMPSSA